jgi:hypothetical protein
VSNPPVSIRIALSPPNSISLFLTSLVVPETSDVIASLSFANLLNRELFPTFGFPIIAICFIFFPFSKEKFYQIQKRVDFHSKKGIS